MAIEIKAPTYPESVQEGTLATWHKQAGDTISRDELIVDIETDKVVLEVVA
ncbi:MAG: dihydrolipoamide succinyltransferase, partial [Porticoccaceae bacterium]|nr:dihydrolipoamide succinyltransferase [Porticoccaceae bacterium]